MTLKLSANLGFLWTDLALKDAIKKAHDAGFDAVECHFPYDVPAAEIAAILKQTGLPMLGLNTTRGDVENGDFGLSALPGREAEARQAIDEAIEYARQSGTQAVHVMAGRTQETSASGAFASNLRYACEKAPDLTILIEPINQRNAPNYYLSSVERGVEIIETLSFPNLKLMFDIYHVAIAQGDVITRMRDTLPYIAHIQFASVPNRAEPDEGEIALAGVIRAALEAGYDGYFGAEYIPRNTTDAGLGWMKTLRKEIG